MANPTRKPTPVGTPNTPDLVAADAPDTGEIAASEDAASAPIADDADQAEETESTGMMTEVRVLRSFERHAPNDVIAVPTALVRQLEREGHVDSDAAAVAYAKSLIA